MDCSTPGLPVPHHLPKFDQVQVCCIGGAILPSHPLMFSSSALNLFQHQGLFRWVGCSYQVTGASASVLPVSIQGWFSLRLTGLISSLSKGISGVFSSSAVWRHQFFGALPVLQSSSPNHMWLVGRPITLTIWTFVGGVMSLLFNTLSRFVIAFLPRSYHFLTSRLQSPSTVILEPKKRTSVIVSTFPPSICNEVMGPDAMILVF